MHANVVDNNMGWLLVSEAQVPRYTEAAGFDARRTPSPEVTPVFHSLNSQAILLSQNTKKLTPWLLGMMALGAVGVGSYYFFPFLYDYIYGNYCAPDHTKDYLPQFNQTAITFNCAVDNILQNLCGVKFDSTNINAILAISCPLSELPVDIIGALQTTADKITDDIQESARDATIISGVVGALFIVALSLLAGCLKNKFKNCRNLNIARSDFPAASPSI